MADIDRNALAALIEAVEMGEWWGDLPRPAELHTDLCWKAFSGSLDAAKALHEALLPGWEWDVASSDAAAVFRGNALHGPAELAAAANPARAWLLAILGALAAEGDDAQR